MADLDIEDIRTVLAICFRDGTEMDSLDLERMISFDMEWLSPSDAETAVQALIASGWLKGQENALSPSIDIANITAPLGWFPRPSRLTNPVAFSLQKTSNKEEIEVSAQPPAEKSAPLHAKAIISSQNDSDPRDKLTKRLTKFIAKSAKIDIAEVERRANRKHKALAVISNWMCLALVAREQGIQMQEIVDALAVR